MHPQLQYALEFDLICNMKYVRICTVGGHPPDGKW